MGLLRDFISTWYAMGKVDPDAVSDAEEEGVELKVGCRPPNVLDDVPPPPSRAESAAQIRARIMATRGVAERTILVDAARCTLCGHCARVCPDGAVTVSETEKRVDPERCTTCACCVSSCPEGAITLHEVKRAEVAR